MITLLFVIGYFLAVLLIAKIFSRRIQSLKDYFLAGQNLGAFPVAITFAATWFGAGSTMGSLNAFYTEGLGALWKIAIPSIISCLIIALLLARRVAAWNTLSQPEAVKKHYGPLGHFLLSWIILASITTFVGSQMVAAGSFFQSILGLDAGIATILVTAVVLIYATLGGYFSVVVTDFLQFGLLGLGFVILTVFVWAAGFNSPEVLSITGHHLSNSWQAFTGMETGSNEPSPLSSHIALTLSFVLAWVIAPEMWQRMTSTGNSQTAFRAALLATGLLAGLFTMVTCVGLFSPALLPPLSSPLPNVLIGLAGMLPYEFLTALVLVGFFAAATSTMDSSINVGSLTLTRDLYQTYLRPHATPSELVWVGRWSTLIVALPAMIIALKFQDILHILWMSADIYAATMFIPMMGVLFMKNPGRWSGLLAMVFGGGCCVVNALVQYGGMSPLTSWWVAPYATLVGVGLSLLGFGLGFFWHRCFDPTLDEKPPALQEAMP